MSVFWTLCQLGLIAVGFAVVIRATYVGVGKLLDKLEERL